MSYSFISYAREDKAFVVQLDRALKAAGSTAWVDWQDIPPSARWMDEIRRAILAADAFVFVISPASAASRSCGWEISIAAENNKRVIPLLLVSDESMKLPPAIADINWIFATTNDEFDAALKQLTTAINVDLEWVRWHSRLLNRAQEWHGANAEESLLLRGWDLEDAERRLAKVGDHKPTLTPLQQEYVACGRWSQRLDEATVLTRQSLVHASRGRHQTAAAYRLRAMELAPQGGAPPQFRASGQKADWAEEAWFLHRYQDRKRGRLRARAAGHGAALSALAVGPGEHLLASGDFDGGFRVWDAMTGDVMLTLDGAHQGPISTIAFTPDGREFWTGSEDGRLLVWTLEPPQVQPYFAEETDPVTSLAFDGDRVAIGLRNGFVAVVDRKTQQPVLHATPHTGAVTFLRFSQDGRLLTASGRPAIGEWPGDSTVHALSLADGRDQVLLIGTLESVGCVALDANGRRAARGMQSGVIEIWDLESGKKTGELTGHEGPVVAAAFLSDGESVLTASADRTLRLWDISASRERRLFDGHLDMASALAVSGDGKTAWSASLDQTVGIWDMEGVTDLRTMKTLGVSVNAVAVDPSGSRAVTGSSEGAIQLWDAATCEPIGTLPDRAHPDAGHQGDVECLAWSADGSTIASGGKDSTLRLWNAGTGEHLKRIGHGGEGVTAVRFIAGSSALLSASGDRFKTVVDRMSFGAAGGRLPTAEIGDGIVLRSDFDRQIVQSLERHPTPIDCLAIDGNGLRAVSGSADATARVWDLESGRQLRLIGVDTSAVVAVAITADGRRVAIGNRDGLIRVWEIEADEEVTAPITLEGHAAGVGEIAFSPDGRTLISVWSDRSIRLWNLETGTGTVCDDDVLETAVAFSADGHTALTGSFDHVVRIWNLETRKPVSVLAGHTDIIWGVAIAPDGRRGLSGSDDGTLRVWDLTSAQPLAVVAGGVGGLKAVAFGADATTAIAACADGLAREWHLERQELIRTFENPAGPASSIGFSRTGPWMVSSSRGGVLAAWQTGSNEPARVLHPRRGGVMTVACSPDGARGLVGGSDGSIRVWDLGRGAELPAPEGHNATVTGVTFTPTGDVAVSASMDGTLCVWNVKTGKPLHVLIGHTAPVLAVAVSPDGRVAASASGDGTARLWDLRGGQQLDVIHVMAHCLAFDARGEHVWLGSGWSGTGWVWTICDSRTATVPVTRSHADGDLSTEMDALYRSIGLRLTGDRRLMLV